MSEHSMRRPWRLGAALAALVLASCGGSDAPQAASAQAPRDAQVLAAAPAKSWTPLTWDDPEPATQYTLADGTLVTHVGGRVRDRHAREIWGPGGDAYDVFAAHYFERRTQDITIYENVSPTNAAERIVTVVVRPQWWLYGTNFRAGYIGRRGDDPNGPASVALYGDNGGMKKLPPFSLMPGQELKTPVANYDALPSDPPSNYDTDLAVPPKPGEFVLVKQLTRNASLGRNYQAGDILEFELGIFLAGNQGDALGRFNYYSEAEVYQVGTKGMQPWYRGPCCDLGGIPWNSIALPAKARAGGDATLQEDTSYQPEVNLMQPATNIAGINAQPFSEGRRLFHTSFIDGSHAEPGNGIFTAQAGKAGPKFQQASCIQCHVNDGKSTPKPGVPLTTMVVLTADVDANGKSITDARFGGHLTQGLVVSGGQTFDGREGLLSISGYKTTQGSYPDKTAYTLQKPQYALTGVDGKALALPARMSVRASPHLVGMGLLEAVPESALQALADGSASDPDGAIGRLQVVPDPVDPKIYRVGRFGWKATSATVRQQAAQAFNADIGVTSTLLPKHLCGLAAANADCRAADAHGPELADADLALVTNYLSLLAVPPQRHFPGEQPVGISGPTIMAQSAEVTAAQVAAEQATQARVTAGAALFDQARCSACHVATLTTGSAHRFAELRNQKIHPYSDLLLHDMGPDLADGFPQAGASGKEWRTPPLWGLGLLASIDPATRYLHDGRARSVEEAILWHGGQGSASRDRFKAMSAADRGKLIEFVNSR
jgi:CxxC motif-containing protein (DUF1111 family)